jgi:hypothetical protein
MNWKLILKCLLAGMIFGFVAYVLSGYEGSFVLGLFLAYSEYKYEGISQQLEERKK